MKKTRTVAECTYTAHGLRGLVLSHQAPDLWIERKVGLPASNQSYQSKKEALRFCSTVSSGETPALERVLQATAQYSICGCSEFAASTPPSWLSSYTELKAGESNQSRLQGI